MALIYCTSSPVCLEKRIHKIHIWIDCTIYTLYLFLWKTFLYSFRMGGSKIHTHWPSSWKYYWLGGIFGFMLVFLWKTRTIKKDRVRYLDSIIFAFLYSAILWYFWTLLGGQVYGIPFNSPISIVYNHSNTIIKDHIPLFPISVLYMILCAVLAVTLRKMSKKILLPDGFIGFMGMGIFSIFLFLWEFLSGSREDMFYDTFYLSLNQIGAIIGIVISILWLINLSSKSK